MRIYLVGGAVRDKLLGLQPKDKDYVVVGSSEEEMLSLGFTKVGADFPVFLKDGAEYALARTERKSGPGYHGFDTNSDPTVTLIEDLERRDLTINSMAMDLVTNELIDPFGGARDLNRSFLRHTSDAFKEDPVRILRVARFAARYNFYLHKTTRDFIVEMVDAGALNELVPERVWAEMARGMMEKRPRQMFQLLDDCNALDALGKHWVGARYSSGLWWTHGPIGHLELRHRFALIAENFTEQQMIDHKIPTECARLGLLLQRWKRVIPIYDRLTASAKVKLLSSIGMIGKDRATDLATDFWVVFDTYGDTRFDTYPISQKAVMYRQAEAINLLKPPEGMKDGKIIAKWMSDQKDAIVCQS